MSFVAFLAPLPRAAPRPQRRATAAPPKRILSRPAAKLHQQAPPKPLPATERPSQPPQPPPPTPQFSLTPQLTLTLTAALTLLSLPLLPSDALQAALANFITGPHLPVTLGIFLSALIQSLTGFGFAIVSVASLTNLPWIANSSVLHSVQPLAATLGALTASLLLFPELHLVKWPSLRPLLLSSTLLTPLGLYLSGFESGLLLKTLGALITAYVAYSATGIKLPKVLATTPGAWFLGGVAGVFGGMFDITGPPLVIYGDAMGWVSEFRRNVLAVLCVNSAIVLLADLVTGRLQDFYYWDFVTWAFPAALVGIFVGKQLGKSLKPHAFKRVVLATCFVLGVKMMLF